jgi:hypothetical protein
MPSTSEVESVILFASTAMAQQATRGKEAVDCGRLEENKTKGENQTGRKGRGKKMWVEGGKLSRHIGGCLLNGNQDYGVMAARRVG